MLLVMKQNFLLHALLCSLLTLCSSIRYDCCLSELSSFGEKCSYSGTTYGNETYYCVSVAQICPNCMLTSAIEIESASCYQCCSTDAYSCGISVSFISTSTWCKFLFLWQLEFLSLWSFPADVTFFLLTLPSYNSVDFYHIRWILLLLLDSLLISWAQQIKRGTNV